MPLTERIEITEKELQADPSRRPGSLLEKRIPKTEPNSLLIIAKPKMGKTTIASMLPNAILLDFESGTDFIHHDASITVTQDTNWGEFMLDAKYFKYCIVDTCSSMEMYFDKVLVRDYNKEHEADENFTPITSMGAIPFGGGWGPVRNKVIGFMIWLESMFDSVIYLGHSKDKQINATATKLDLAMQGKLAALVLAHVDLISYMRIDDNERTLMFNNPGISIGGGRLSYKDDELVISSMKDDVVTTYWEKIYPIGIASLSNKK